MDSLHISVQESILKHLDSRALGSVSATSKAIRDVAVYMACRIRVSINVHSYKHAMHACTHASTHTHTYTQIHTHTCFCPACRQVTTPPL